MSWDDRWFELCETIKGWSKDKHTKVSCVIINNRNVVVSLGWNGFPRGVDDSVQERYERPLKYKWFEHAERNAIYNAASKGIALLGCIIYVPWYPCVECGRAIIQSGISTIVCEVPDFEHEIWGEDFKITNEMFSESSIKQRWIP